MKKVRLFTIAFLLTLSLSSAVLAGCAGCGTTNDNNMNDMVESTPANTEEGILETETENGTVSEPSQNDVENTVVPDNTNLTDSNGNPIIDDENIVDDAGDVVGGAVENVGDAAKDVVDGVGNGMKSLVE